MSFDPWYKAAFTMKALGVDLKLEVPHDVFSTLRIDEGTWLLLENLPQFEPRSVLDMGCGYGALGLPVAAKFPSARVEMVDRDLLAVTWSQKNAQEARLFNTEIHSSLGYRDLNAHSERYDWILCNVPARIGRPFIEDLFESGLGRLNPGGEIRVVVIRDLGPLIEDLKRERGWDLIEKARGPRHVVYTLMAVAASTLAARVAPKNAQILYARDHIEFCGFSLERPFDITGDSVRMMEALPVLLDALPRSAPKRIFNFRCAYGAMALACATRYPQSRVVATDRDVLATTFARENAERLKVAPERFEVRERVDFQKALAPSEKFDLCVGELSSSAGERVAEAELAALSKALAPGGQALVLTFERIEQEWIMPIAKRRKLSLARLMARGGYCVLRLN